MKKHYTLEQANETLPYVRSVVREVKELYQNVKENSRRHNEIPKSESERRADLRREIQAEAARIHECQEELFRIGAELKDYETGLVDFPTELDGRRILLCWKDGEETIAHWHETDTGFRDRRPVPENDPAWPLSATATPR